MTSSFINLNSFLREIYFKGTARILRYRDIIVIFNLTTFSNAVLHLRLTTIKLKEEQV